MLSKENLFEALSQPVAAEKERTFVMVMHDGVQRGIIGTIVSRFEKKGMKLVGMKLCQPGRAKFEEHYADL